MRVVSPKGPITRVFISSVCFLFGSGAAFWFSGRYGWVLRGCDADSFHFVCHILVGCVSGAFFPRWVLAPVYILPGKRFAFCLFCCGFSRRQCFCGSLRLILWVVLLSSPLLEHAPNFLFYFCLLCFSTGLGNNNA